MDVAIHKLVNHEVALFKELIKLFEEVFEMEKFTIHSYDYLGKLLSKEGFEVFIAIYEGKVVGGLTVYILQQYYHTNKPLAYIYDLAVATSLQRKGIGQKLIRAVNDFATLNNFEEVFVQADRIDDYALDFYRKTNPTNEENVVHFYYTIN